MPDVFTVLDKDHREVEQMLVELSDPAMNHERRRELADKLVMEESKHEAVEEMYFWPKVQERLPDGEKLAGKAIHQEDEGKEVLQKIANAQSSNEDFSGPLTKFIGAAREHILYEETQVWPKLREVLSASEAEELGKQLSEGKSSAPTRPHPHTPSSSGVQKTAGAAAAMLDKARDAATGRG